MSDWWLRIPLRVRRFLDHRWGHAWYPVGRAGKLLVVRCVRCEIHETLTMPDAHDYFQSLGIFTDDILP